MSVISYKVQLRLEMLQNTLIFFNVLVVVTEPVYIFLCMEYVSMFVSPVWYYINYRIKYWYAIPSITNHRTVYSLLKLSLKLPWRYNIFVINDSINRSHKHHLRPNKLKKKTKSSKIHTTNSQDETINKDILTTDTRKWQVQINFSGKFVVLLSFPQSTNKNIFQIDTCVNTRKTL